MSIKNACTDEKTLFSLTAEIPKIPKIAAYVRIINISIDLLVFDNKIDINQFTAMYLPLIKQFQPAFNKSQFYFRASVSDADASEEISDADADSEESQMSYADALDADVDASEEGQMSFPNSSSILDYYKNKLASLTAARCAGYDFDFQYTNEDSAETVIPALINLPSIEPCTNLSVNLENICDISLSDEFSTNWHALISGVTKWLFKNEGTTKRSIKFRFNFPAKDYELRERSIQELIDCLKV